MILRNVAMYGASPKGKPGSSGGFLIITMFSLTVCVLVTKYMVAIMIVVCLVFNIFCVLFSFRIDPAIGVRLLAALSLARPF